MLPGSQDSLHIHSFEHMGSSLPSQGYFTAFFRSHSECRDAEPGQGVAARRKSVVIWLFTATSRTVARSAGNNSRNSYTLAYLATEETTNFSKGCENPG
jgi:hypothetical protein